MSIRLLAVPILAFVSLTASCSRSPATHSSSNNQPISSERVVNVVASPVELTAGGSTSAVVQVKIQNGYHINANPPTYPYLKATEVTLKPTDGLSVGFITYPKSISRKLQFADDPIAIYEGNAELKVLLKAAPTANKGSSNLSAKLKVQACDDQVCFPPGEIEFAIPVTVK